MTIIAAMEIVHKVMINGTDNIPPLDPFFMEQLLDFESDQDKYNKYFVVLPIWWSKFNSALSFHTHRLQLLVDNTWVTNLAAFVVDSVKTNVFRFTMDMQLSLASFNIDGHYAMDGKVSLFPLFGSCDY